MPFAVRSWRWLALVVVGFLWLSLFPWLAGNKNPLGFRPRGSCCFPFPAIGFPLAAVAGKSGGKGLVYSGTTNSASRERLPGETDPKSRKTWKRILSGGS
jgi:hypothetical protein